MPVPLVTSENQWSRFVTDYSGQRVVEVKLQLWDKNGKMRICHETLKILQFLLSDQLRSVCYSKYNVIEQMY